MYYLQVIERDQYKLLADENRIDLQLLAPPRGRIVDRFGAVLAENQQNYQVQLIAEQAASVEETMARLARLIPIDEAEHRRVLREVKRKRDFVPVTVSENLSWEQFANVNVHMPDLPGVQPDIGESRHYPVGRAMAHVVGYVGAVSEDEQTGDPLLELPGFRVGKNGVERVYDEPLRGKAGNSRVEVNAFRGKAGNSRVEVNAFGRVIRELQREDGRPGDDLVLTIDSELQQFADDRLGEESGAAAVLDIHSGQVLALASTPSFEPNAFAHGISVKDWRALINNPRNPLVNKAIAGQYPPGSTFKVAVALAALESGILNAGHRVFCKGSVKLGRAKFHCWKKGGHGWRTMPDAIQQSCDVYFYDVAQRIGINRIAEMARRLGLGDTFGLELPGERPGLVPDRDWKLAVHGVPWQKGETLISGIGQGFLLTTPLQLAVMTARIANGGFAVKPRLVRRLEGRDKGGDGDETPAEGETGKNQAPPRPPSLGLASSSLGVVLEGMNLVSNHPRGTAYRSRITEPGFELAGKTGTSQVRRISKAERNSRVRKNEEKPWIERDHALFVAFAPVAAPRYAAAAVIEHGGSGSRAAAPVVRDILLKAQQLDPAGKLALGDGAPAGAGRGEG
jgi:penicillin-binding protein 2